MLIDFERPAEPVVTPVRADLAGYAICVTDTGGSHANLTPDYAAITEEMKSVAGYFGKQFLREVNPADFYANIKALRQFGDRAVVRSIHFFEENERAAAQAAFLKDGNIEGFLKLIRESGRSSAFYLQNIYSLQAPSEQGIMLGLAISDKVLGDRGASRVHGGGFAGTVLAFMPYDLREIYERCMAEVFGENACHFLNIREKGGMEVS
jgi:galactokinase